MDRRSAGPLLAVFVVALVVFGAFSGPRLLHQSAAPHFVYQAMAFLQGRLDIAVEPPNHNDWARGPDGKLYVSFPPAPALLLVPGAAVFGYQLGDVPFTVLLAALNAALLFALLQALSRAGESRRSAGENLALTAFFAFGTVNLVSSIRGEVWFTAHVVGVGCSVLFLLAARRLRHPLLAGVALTLGALTRTPLALAAVYFLGELLCPDGRLELPADPAERRRRLRALLLFAAPCLLGAALAAWFNAARFGDPLEFGHRFLFENRVNEEVARYGLFDLHYLGRNLRSAFLLLPTLERAWPPRLGWDPQGMSLLVTTPLLLLLLAPREPGRLHRLLWLTIPGLALPALLYMNTGYVQFGYRFALDWMPYLFVLLAVGGRRLSPPWLGLGAAGVAVNVWGALVF